MKKVPFIFAVVVSFVFLVSCSCTTAPETEAEATVPPSQKAETPKVEPQTETEEKPKPEEPAEQGKEESKSEPAKFEVSEELYKQTFDDIKSIIEELNRIIRSREYKTWLTYLTEEYVENTSRPEYLRRWQKDPRLIEKNIVLRTLKDYFDYVVVPTRSQAKLDEIEFRDDTHVYAYTVFEGKTYLLYYLVKTEEGWKIDFY
jgi:membrane-associated HD superfamily phosphohydrolase